MGPPRPPTGRVTSHRARRWWIVPAFVIVGLAGPASTADGQAQDEDQETVADATAAESATQPAPTSSVAAAVAPSSPTEVKIDVDVEQITRIEERANLFEVDATLTARWTDKRDRPACPAPDQVFDDELADEVLKSGLWAPTFIVAAGRGSRETIALEVNVRCDGTVTYQERFSAVVSQRFTNLNDFPFDQHDIRFTIEPFGASGKNAVRFEPFARDEQSDAELASARKQADKYESEEWNFTVDDRPVLISDPPSITTTVRIDRSTFFYWVNVILPLVFIVSISWTVFWMKPVLAERLSVSITILLTVVAFDFLTGDSLPRLPFTTRLDQFYNVSYLFVLATIVLSLVATRLRRSGRSTEDDDADDREVAVDPGGTAPDERRRDAGHRVDRWSRIVFLPAYLVIVAILLTTGVGSQGRDDAPAEPRAAVAPSVPDAPPEGRTRLEPDSPVSEQISEPGERDEFEICGSPTDSTSVLMAWDIADADGTLDPLLELYATSDGALVAFDDDGGGNLDSLLVLPPSGDCFVLVASDLTGEGTGDYTLTVDVGEPPVLGDSLSDELLDADIAFDDYDALTADSIELTVGDSQTASISAPGDVHSYRVCATADAGDLAVRMARAPGADGEDLDPFLLLYDEDGTFLDEDDDGAGDLDSLLVLPPTDGCLIVLAGDLGGIGTGAYTLTLEEGVPEIVDAQADVEALDVEDLFGVSFGELEAVSTELEPGDELAATIVEPGEVHAYTVCSTSDDATVAVVMERATDADDDGLDPFLVAYDELGAFVAFDDDGAGNLDSLLVLPPTDECHLVVAADSIGDATGDYTLVVLVE